jgi:hypothetical protein
MRAWRLRSRLFARLSIDQTAISFNSLREFIQFCECDHRHDASQVV